MKKIHFYQSSAHMWNIVYLLRKILGSESVESIHMTKIWDSDYFAAYWERK